MQFKDIPEGAVQHLRSDYGRTRYKRSRWILGKKLKEYYQVCPRCHDEVEMEHGVPGGCCDLKWVAFGNGLWLWRISEKKSNTLNLTLV